MEPCIISSIYASRDKPDVLDGAEQTAELEFDRNCEFARLLHLEWLDL